ncbi:glycoside hydrolase family 25 protein [Flavobacterium sp.]|uniref:glycoside hydrolase family 25 protein n=1 Tax=Flavobacterium sp. TaxID=239 RepID=UPI002FDABB24
MRKPRSKRSVNRKSPQRKSGKRGIPLGWVIGFVILLGLCFSVYHYRTVLAYYFSFKSKHSLSTSASKVEEAHVFQVLSRHPHYVFGFDVSEYQGDIAWEKVSTVADTFQLHFVFIRATAGKDKVDARFKTNWASARKQKFIRGAYHYYRPNENSILQAQNFIRQVALEKGDLPPVLDIENLPKVQSMDSLKVGLKRWLTTVEAHYGIKPIIYSGESYYTDFLAKEFKGYPFWIANYNFFVESPKENWLFWQFSEKGSVSGIQGLVDINLFQGTPKMLHYQLKH